MIEINNLTTNQIEENSLRKIAELVLKEEKKENKDLSIALVGPGRIRKLNQKYRKKNRVTDVLSFPEKEIGLGEIVICLREVKKNAKRFNSHFQKELARVLIHSILHLLGYDHQKPDQEKIMKEKENYYLNLWQKTLS